MKKQLNLFAPGRKLGLNKKTISNLKQHEMANNVGGAHSYFGGGGCHTCDCTYGKGNTCLAHKTCYTC